LVFSPDGKILASGSFDDTVRLWDMANPATPHPLGQPLKGHTSRVFSLAFSPNGDILASGSEDKTLQIWALR
jgi:WD40 repeat protein